MTIYLDSSAVVKLVHAEESSEALRAWLEERADTAWMSSVLVETEAFRALARHAPSAVGRLHSVIELIELIELDWGVRQRAMLVVPPSVRSLDAIHVASALTRRRQLTSFVTYDRRLADAAAIAGLAVSVPMSQV